MGSGQNNRKKNDAPIIRRPAQAIQAITGIPDFGGMAADKCLPSFDVKVDQSALTKPKIKVTLQLHNGRYAVMVAASTIGQLSEKQSETVGECLKLGVKYSGVIIEKNGRVYARFNRVF